MEMHDVEVPRHRGASRTECCRPIKPPQPSRGEIVNLDTIEVDGTVERHVAIARSVDIRREHMDVVPGRSKAAAQSVHGIDRPAVTKCGDIGRRDMEKAHWISSHCPPPGDDIVLWAEYFIYWLLQSHDFRVHQHTHDP